MSQVYIFVVLKTRFISLFYTVNTKVADGLLTQCAMDGIGSHDIELVYRE